MAELLEFDATGSNLDGSDPGSPLSVMNTNYRVTAHSYPAPALNVLYASSVDTEGGVPASRHFENRTISITVEMVDATGSLLRALQGKMSKLAREGGTLKRTMKTGEVVIYDLLTSEQFDPSFDVAYYGGNLVTVSLAFGAKPFGRGVEQTLTAHTESTLPCLAFTETGILGDIPALGRLIITEAQGQDQWFVMWGQQSRNYSSSTNAALFYEAESRTPMGVSATATGATGASGTAPNVVRNTDLGLAYQAVLSTQASGGGSHLSHVGDFQVWARVQAPTTNTGTVTVALEWAQADLSGWTRNPEAQVSDVSRGAWVLVNLGQVHLEKAVQGTQRWEGRVVARSTEAGDDVDIDCLMLAPIAEGYGEARGVVSSATPSTFLARDDFNQTAGNATGKTLTTGGTWTGVVVTAPGTVDFTIDATNHYLTRTGTSLGERVIHNNTNYASVVAQVDMLVGTASEGFAVRFVDSSNFFYVFVTSTITYVYKKVAGALVILAQATIAGPVNDFMTYRMFVDTVGRWTVHRGPQGGALALLFAGQHPDLATGGVLATGKVGAYDIGFNANPRYWDNFRVWNPATDPAMFASQSLEVRHDQVIRESSDGTAWRAASVYEGGYLRIPPAGAEGRTLRMFVKASRNDPKVGGDPAIDDITAQIKYVPRYLVTP